MKKYIYKITNKINGKSYIGQTNNYNRRFMEHRGMYDTTGSKVLYQAFKKYGINNFDFEILGEYENYNEMEVKFTEEFDTINNGYNVANGGEQPPLKVGVDNPLSTHTLEDVLEVKRLLRETDLQIEEIGKITGYSESGIDRINHGKIWKVEGEKYPIRGRKKLSDEQITEIIDLLLNTKLSHREIGDKYGFARTTISALNKGKNWRREGYTYPLRKSS